MLDHIQALSTLLSEFWADFPRVELPSVYPLVSDPDPLGGLKQETQSARPPRGWSAMAASAEILSQWMRSIKWFCYSSFLGLIISLGMLNEPAILSMMMDWNFSIHIEMGGSGLRYFSRKSDRSGLLCLR